MEMKDISSLSGGTSFEIVDAQLFELPNLEAVTSMSVFIGSGATFKAKSLSSMDSGSITFDGNNVGTFDAKKLTELTNTTVVLRGSQQFLSGELTNVDGSRFRVLDGAELSLNMGQFNLPLFRSEGAAILEASGADSELKASSIRRMLGRDDPDDPDDGAGGIGAGGFFGGPATYSVIASDGGSVDLSGLTEVLARDVAPFSDVSRIIFEETAGGQIDLSKLERAEIIGSDGFGIIIRPDAREYNLSSLRSGLALSVETVPGTLLLLGAQPEQSNQEPLDLVQSRVVVVPGATVSAPKLGSIAFTTIDADAGGVISENAFQFDASGVTAIDGSRFIAKGGARVTIGDPVDSQNPPLTYDAFFFTDLPSGSREEPPDFIAEGAGSLVDLRRLVKMQVSLGTPGFNGGGITGTIRASDGGVVDLSSLAELEAAPTGGAFEQDPAAQFITAEAGGVIKLGDLRTAGAVKFEIDGAASQISAAGLDLPSGEFPIFIPGDASAYRNGSSLLLRDRGRLRFRSSAGRLARFNYAHDPGGLITFDGLIVNAGGIDMNRGVVEFAGDGPTVNLSEMHAVGPPLMDLGSSLEPELVELAFSEEEAPFGIGQLIVGSPGEPVDLLLTRGYYQGAGGTNPTLYLWGFNQGQPDFDDDGLPDDDGGTGVDSLVIHDGSRLLIPENIDVVYYDGAEYVHINALFSEGTNEIAFDGGFIGLTPSLPLLPGDFNGDDVVDAADYSLWRDNLGATSGPGLVADATGPSGFPDGVVDVLDYQEWRTNYGAAATPSEPATQGVPEPMAAVLLGCGLLAASVGLRGVRA